MWYHFQTTQQWISIRALSEKGARQPFADTFPHIPESAIRRIYSDRPVTGHRQPTPAEINRGCGAIHYKDFDISLWVRKGRMSLKKWIKCPHDGLRYYCWYFVSNYPATQVVRFVMPERIRGLASSNN